MLVLRTIDSYQNATINLPENFPKAPKFVQSFFTSRILQKWRPQNIFSDILLGIYLFLNLRFERRFEFGNQFLLKVNK